MECPEDQTDHMDVMADQFSLCACKFEGFGVSQLIFLSVKPVDILVSTPKQSFLFTPILGISLSCIVDLLPMT